MDDTKEKILAATERLIIEHGWNKVTFRMITSEAGVNLAAINYHFGSREALEDALLPRLTGPLDEKRTKYLKDAKDKAAPNNVSVHEILRCFLEPMHIFSQEYPKYFDVIHQFFIGIQNKEKIFNHFKNSLVKINQEFVELLYLTLPGVPKEKLLIQYIILFESSHVLMNTKAFDGMVDSLGLDTTKEEFIEEMIDFFSAGLYQLENRSNPIE